MANIYFYKGANALWSTIGNWFTDALHTTPSVSFPSGSDDVICVGAAGNGPEVDLDTWTAPASIDATDTGISFTSAIASTVVGLNVTGDVTMNGNAETQITTITGDVVANDDAKIGGPVTGTATFNDNSCVDTAGTIVGAATFNDSSYNGGLCEAGATFNDSSHNDNVVQGTGTFNDSSYNGEDGTVEDMVLNDQSENRAGVSGSFSRPGYGINGSAILGMP